MKLKNEMLINTSDDSRYSREVRDLKKHMSYHTNGGEKWMKENMRELKQKIKLNNLVAKQLFIHNPELLSKWSKAEYHYECFVKIIMNEVNDGTYPVERMGKIEAIDDGSRGLNKTFQMHLYDIDGNILDVSSEFCTEWR